MCILSSFSLNSLSLIFPAVSKRFLQVGFFLFKAGDWLLINILLESAHKTIHHLNDPMLMFSFLVFSFGCLFFFFCVCV